MLNNYHSIVITSKALAERRGELRLTDLTCILPKKAYPSRMHEFLIGLMRKFELCFPYHDDPAEHRYLVPELLGKEEPALKEPFPLAECLNFRYDYRLMPEGLLPRFITRTHTMSEPSERWRTGVVLRWEGCRAQVKADKQERQVLVRVLGEPEKRRRLLAVIRENFDQIHVEMKEFKPTEWIALEGHPEAWSNLHELHIFERQQVKEIPKTVGMGVQSLNVTSMLDATDVRGVRIRAETQPAERQPLRLFISYAREVERWRTKLEPNLGLMRREKLISYWHDRDLVPSAEWEDEIKRRLSEAEIILFLVSTYLLNSDFIHEWNFRWRWCCTNRTRPGWCPFSCESVDGNAISERSRLYLAPVVLSAIGGRMTMHVSTWKRASAKRLTRCANCANALNSESRQAAENE